MRTVAAVLLILAVVACNEAPKATIPEGPTGDVQREALALRDPNAEIPDYPLDEVLGKIDLNKAYGARARVILDQVRGTRSAVEKRSSSTARGGHLASVTPAVGGFSFAQFRYDFGFNLDDCTNKGCLPAPPANPFSATQDDGNTTTTTTLSVTESFTAAKSVVTASVRWTYSSITIDMSPNGGGATLFHLQDEREFSGTIDVCPDGGGNVPATLTVTSKLVAEDKGEITRRSSEGHSTFNGSVNEQASLTGVAQESAVETSTDSTSGTGGHISKISATWTPSSGDSLSDLAPGSFKVLDFKTKGITSAVDAAKAAGWDSALGIFAVEAAYVAARDLWRAGRCVVVAVDEYKAETPIQKFEQQKVQHDEEVDVSSDTKFNMKLRQRFTSEALNKPTNAELVSGKEKLSPNKVDGPGGQLTYKAGDEDGKEATAQLRSTSNRGIGTLVLKFHTGGQALTLTLQGTNTIGPQQKQLVATVKIGPATFKKGDGDTWTASGPFTGTSKLVPPDKDCPDLQITETGTAQFTAKVVTQGEQKFWVVHGNLGGNTSVKATGCDTAASYSSGLIGGLMSGLFIGAIGDITIPYDGGTVSVGGANAGGGRASGTAVGTIEKK